MYLERIYIFALMWSIGALLELDDRSRLEKFWRHDLDVTLDLPKVNESKSETVFEYFVDNRGTSITDCIDSSFFLRSPYSIGGWWW